MIMDLTREQVMAVVSYDPETGKFTRTTRKGKVGTYFIGYQRIVVCGRQCLAHRLAWLIVFGVWPSGHLDHINRDRSDNRIANLRLATPSQNSANIGLRKHSKSGLVGATFHKSAKKWRAVITHKGKQKHLGYFDTPQKAHVAYRDASRELHGEFSGV